LKFYCNKLYSLISVACLLIKQLMKHFLVIVFLAVLGSSPAFAQKNNIVGKWTFASISSSEFSFDLENPVAAKKLLIEEIKKEGGQIPDSTTLDLAITMMTAAFDLMSFEFTTDGKAIFSAPAEEGGLKQETAKYTVDYTAGTLTTIETIDGKEKKEVIKISFKGDYLTMEKVDKKEIIKVKRAK